MVGHSIQSRTRASTVSLAWSNEFRPFAMSTSMTLWDNVVGRMGGCDPVDYSQDVVPSDYIDQVKSVCNGGYEGSHFLVSGMVVVMVRKKEGGLLLS